MKNESVVRRSFRHLYSGESPTAKTIRNNWLTPLRKPVKKTEIASRQRTSEAIVEQIRVSWVFSKASLATHKSTIRIAA